VVSKKPNKQVPQRRKSPAKNKSNIVKLKQDGKTIVRITDANGAVTELNSSLLSDAPKSVAAMIREVGSFEDDKTQRANMFAVIIKAFEQAKAGDPQARDYLTDRLEGKAIQRQVIQNIDVLQKVVEVLNRLIDDPLLMAQIIYEFESLARMEEDRLLK
jgi:hypothetical protein